MPDEIRPQATPTENRGDAEWLPPHEDDAAAAPSPASAIRYIFYGQDGLRAGWSLLLWFVFIAILGKGLSLILHHLVPAGTVRKGGPLPEWLLLSNSAGLFLITGLAGLFVSLIERRSWTAYGINSIRGRVGQFAAGLVWGFVLLSALVLLLWKTGYLVFAGNLHGAGTILLWATLYFVSFLFTGFAEEFTFRAFPQFTLARGIAGILRSAGLETHARAVAFWITALLLGILSGAVHGGNPGESPLGLYAAGLIGICFAFSLWRTGSLWWAIGFHAAWDWAESYFYGTADSGLHLPHSLFIANPQGNTSYSGGSVGPEGSIWVFAIIALTALVIFFTVRPQPGSPSREP